MQTFTTYELQPRYDTRQSFYGKAKVKESTTTGEHGQTVLYDLISYNTLVGKVLVSDIDGERKKSFVYFGKYSQTTTRHQKEFFKQFGLSDRELKELFKNNTLEKEG